MKSFKQWNHSVVWLAGAFYEYAPYYDRKMLDPEDLDSNGNSNVSLTAHVLAAMAEAQEGLNSEAAICVSEAISKAREYVEGYTERIEVSLCRDNMS